MATEIWNMAVATTDALAPNSKNPSMFSGAIDIIIVKHSDGSYRSTPFHARFGKYLAAKPFNLNVDITINGEKLDNINMTLNSKGIAHFDGVQNEPQKEEKEEKQEKEKEVNAEEEKAETTTTDDGSDKNKNISIKVDNASTSNNEQKEKMGKKKEPKRERKRDKLKAYMKSSWSHRSGSEAEEEDDENKDVDKEKKEKRVRKRDIIKGYITNTMDSLQSKWVIEDDVVNVNNIPSDDLLNRLITKLQSGKNEIIFSIKTPSKMDKFKKKIFLQTTALKEKYSNPKKNDMLLIMENDDGNDNESDNEVIDTMDVTPNGDDDNKDEIKLKTREISANIYLWNDFDRIIISDVDGTITKSDLGGHLLPNIGYDYVQIGICELIKKMEENGYCIIYLTARGIGQSYITRNYLFNTLKLPFGAVICSPSTISAALYREVIEKKPEKFKVPTLNQVINAFNGKNPFCGGFGNRISDAKTYKFLNIDKSKIFIIQSKKKNKKKENDDNKQIDNDDVNDNKENENEQEIIATFITDYNEILKNVDEIFPKLSVD